MTWNPEAREKTLDLQAWQAQPFQNKQQLGPQRSVKEACIFWSQILRCRFWNQVNAHARLLNHVNHGVLYDRIGQAFHDLIPPGIMSCGVFKAMKLAGKVAQT